MPYKCLGFFSLFLLLLASLPHTWAQEPNSNGLIQLEQQRITIPDIDDKNLPIWLVIEPEASLIGLECQNVVQPTPGCIIKNIAARAPGTVITIQCLAEGAEGLSQACKIGPFPESRIQMRDFFYMAHLDSITLIFNGGKWAELSRANVTPTY